MLFYQNRDGYCYNSDTKFLYDFISKFKPKGELLDIGCGCGILGQLLAKESNFGLTQIDIIEKNFFLTSKNATINKIESNVILGDFLESEFDKKFDFIISNPPFYEYNGTLSKNEILSISRYNKFLPIESFFKKVNSLLKPKGEFIICYDSKQLIDIITVLNSLKMPLIDMKFIHAKEDSDSHLVLIRIKKSSKSKLKVHKPLFVQIDGEFSQQANEIFKRSEANSIKCQV